MSLAGCILNLQFFLDLQFTLIISLHLFRPSILNILGERTFFADFLLAFSTPTRFSQTLLTHLAIQLINFLLSSDASFSLLIFISFRQCRILSPLLLTLNKCILFLASYGLLCFLISQVILWGLGNVGSNGKLSIWRPSRRLRCLSLFHYNHRSIRIHIIIECHCFLISSHR